MNQLFGLQHRRDSIANYNFRGCHALTAVFHGKIWRFEKLFVHLHGEKVPKHNNSPVI